LIFIPRGHLSYFDLHSSGHLSYFDLHSSGSFELFWSRFLVVIWAILISIVSIIIIYFYQSLLLFCFNPIKYCQHFMMLPGMTRYWKDVKV
jgi:hypothetical protein